MTTVRVLNDDPALVTLPDPGGAPSFDGPRAAPIGGAPLGADPSPVEEDELTALINPESVREGVESLFAFVATRRGPHWQLDRDEAENIAEPLTVELRGIAERAPFLGRAVGAVGGHRIELAAALGFAIVPRVKQDAALARARAAQAAQAGRPAPPAAAGGTTHPTPPAPVTGDAAAVFGDDPMAKILTLPVKEL